jgi:hypothetical protein
VGIADGQDNRAQLEKRYGFTVADAEARLKSGDFAGVHINLLAETGAVEAIPDLEKQFVQTSDPLNKAKIAQALVKLRDKDDTYWNFLVQLTMPIIESDAPNPISMDSNGKFVPTSAPSPEFTIWAKAHNLDPGNAAMDAIYLNPGKIMLLGGTDDPRAIPLLRRALLSPNYLIAAVAARGLAEVHDDASIQTIIETCKRAPADAAASIAKSLVFFDDPRAQTAVDKYLPKEDAKSLREARAQGKTPLH